MAHKYFTIFLLLPTRLSVLFPTPLLTFINNLLSLTSNLSIFAFAEDCSSICHSYSFGHRQSLLEIEAEKGLTKHLKLMTEWGCLNRTYFKERKTQCCVSSVTWDNVNIKEPEALNTLGMSTSWRCFW